MLSHCANSQCSKPFLRLREGRLFLVETNSLEPSGLKKRAATAQRKTPKRVEHFWLCDQCASLFTLVPHPSQGIALIPLNQATGCGQRPEAEVRTAV
jgi:hypothetical protein